MEKTYEMLQQYAVNSLEYQKGRALHQRGQAALSSAEEAPWKNTDTGNG